MVSAMDGVRFGSAVRALRHRRGLTQAEVAVAALVSQAAVSRCESGDVESLTLKAVARIIGAVGGTVSLRAYWNGAELERLLDAAHAGLVERVVEILVANGWVVIPEATFSIYGERGSIDVLAYHPAHGAVLVVEVKSVVPDLQSMLAGIDRKVRLAPRIARERGWRVGSVSRLLVLPDDPTARRRLARHLATVDQTMPLRTVAVRSWLAKPVSAMGGVSFLANPAQGNTRRRVTRERG